MFYVYMYIYIFVTHIKVPASFFHAQVFGRGLGALGFCINVVPILHLQYLD